MTERDNERTRRAKTYVRAMRVGMAYGATWDTQHETLMKYAHEVARESIGGAFDLLIERLAPYLDAQSMHAVHAECAKIEARLASPPDGEPAGGAESSEDDELTEWELHTAVRIAAHHGGLRDARVAVHQLVAMAHARGMVYGAALAEPPTPSAPCFSDSQEDSNALASPGAVEPHSLSQAKRFAVQRGEDPAKAARTFRDKVKVCGNGGGRIVDSIGCPATDGPCVPQRARKE